MRAVMSVVGIEPSVARFLCRLQIILAGRLHY